MIILKKIIIIYKVLPKEKLEAISLFPDQPDAKEDVSNIDDQNLTAKEHFVFTDPLGQLYHFSVEGNAIRDGTKLPAEASLSKFNIQGSSKQKKIIFLEIDGSGFLLLLKISLWGFKILDFRN